MSKTAMQELIDVLDKRNQDYYKEYKLAKGANKKKWDDAMSVQTLAVIEAKKLLEKEKQQIIEAHTHKRLLKPTVDSHLSILKEAEDYYNHNHMKHIRKSNLKKIWIIGVDEETGRYTPLFIEKCKLSKFTSDKKFYYSYESCLIECRNRNIKENKYKPTTP